jgi:hypothetical protein
MPHQSPGFNIAGELRRSSGIHQLAIALGLRFNDSVLRGQSGFAAARLDRAGRGFPGALRSIPVRLGQAIWEEAGK